MWMIKNKLAIAISFILLVICMSIYFPFPNNEMIKARSTFMTFPIRNEEGYVFLGIFTSVLFVISLVLLQVGLKKYHFRTLVLVILAFALLPLALITIFQETFAEGIYAIKYDGNGNCNFEYMSEDLLNGECSLVLHNRSNESVSFQLDFIDSNFYGEDGIRMESLMNVAGPFHVTIEANRKESIHLKELLDVTGIPKHIDGGSSSNIHIKLTEGQRSRNL